MNPYKTITGGQAWLEDSIPDFRFKGVGWYKDGTLLITEFGELCYQVAFYLNDPRPDMKTVLDLKEF